MGGVKDFDLFTYSFPCFVAGTLVHTNNGFVPIEDVKAGDSVLTHTNSYRRILKVGRRHDAPLMKVRGMCFKDITCTPNHPFYVRKRYKVWDNPIRKYDRKFTAPEWVKAKDLTRDHYIGYAINQKSELPKWGGITAYKWKSKVERLSAFFENGDFWYLMGRYVGDGWKKTSATGSGIVICCSERNKDSLLNALESIGWHYTISEERTATRFIISSNELYHFVDRYGYKAHGKFIDEETMNLPADLLRSFVKGYVDSDGCFSENEYKAASVSEGLMYGMQQCISKAYKCPVRMYWCKRKPTTMIEGRVVNQHDSYGIVWHSERRKQDKAFYEDGYVWFPVKGIVALEERGTVYNMEVENDNSYTANGAIVHNCTDISNAGRQAGLAEGSGSRSSLLWECRKAVVAKHPKYLLMENVKALVSNKFMPYFKTWLDFLTHEGYANYAQILNAKDYGVPQNRERIFVVSILGDDWYNFPKPFPLGKSLLDILEPEVDEKYFIPDEKTMAFICPLPETVRKKFGIDISADVLDKYRKENQETKAECGASSDDEETVEDWMRIAGLYDEN